MNAIIDFYSLKGTDTEGRTFHDVIQSDDEFWETCHGHYGVRT